MTKTLEQLNNELAVAYADANYWSQRRKGQVGNCISDQEHHTEAWRRVQSLEYQIKEYKHGIQNS